jgi:DNA-binding LacI/PurR family transcriptional regulator
MPKPPVRVGIRDVAKAAGLSITTVSWALNDKGEVAAATRSRVRQIAADLGYRPNAAARTLKSGRSRILAVAIGHRESGPWAQTYLPYYRSVVAGAAIEAVEHGHAVAALPVGPHGSVMSSVPYDGLIVVDPVRNDPILAECRQRAIPVVADGRPLDAGYDDVPVVESDIRHGMNLVLDHMSASGARRPALLTGAEPDAYTLDTERHYRNWCRRTGRPSTVRRVHHGESARLAAAELLTRGADAIHGLNETYGNAVLAAAADRGLKVPADLIVTMMGERDAAQSHNGAAYLVLDTVVIGATCVRLLVDLIEGRTAQTLMLPCELVVPRTAG